MLNEWLSYSPKSPCPYGSFRVIDVSEIKVADTSIIEYLGTEVLNSYRNLSYLKFTYESTNEQSLKDYLNNYVFAKDTTTLTRNVRQGDFGEILASLIVMYFQGLIVPIHKMRYKFNKDRSVFCTDMMAHNSGERITDLYYYEIKSRQNIAKETIDGLYNYVTVHAHNSLLKDEQTPNEAIADFLTQRHFELEEYDSAAKYRDIVLNSNTYNRKFELFFIIEKSTYRNDILQALQDLPPSLNPLCITLVLVENLQQLVKDIFDRAITNAVSYVFPPAS